MITLLNLFISLPITFILTPSSSASEEDVPVHNNTWYGYTKLLSDGLVQLRCE